MRRRRTREEERKKGLDAEGEKEEKGRKGIKESLSELTVPAARSFSFGQKT